MGKEDGGGEEGGGRGRGRRGTGRRRKRRRKTHLRSALYSSVHHNNSPLLEVNVAKRERQKRGLCSQKGSTTTERGWLHGVPRKTEPGVAAKAIAGPLPHVSWNGRLFLFILLLLAF